MEYGSKLKILQYASHVSHSSTTAVNMNILVCMYVLCQKFTTTTVIVSVGHDSSQMMRHIQNLTPLMLEQHKGCSMI